MCNKREDESKLAKSYNEKLNRKQRDERLDPHGYGTHSKSPRKPGSDRPKNPYTKPTATSGGYFEFTVTPSKVTNNKYLELNLDAMAVAIEAVSLLVKKHKDYGPTNISHAPGGALNGLSVRLHDKVARLGNLLASGKSPQNESIRDTLIDILNYAVIALLVIDEKWETK
jgi:hypothetical protein